MTQDDAAGTSTGLNRDRVLRGAVELADAIGIEPLTIRKLAEHLDTKPMTLYHHVANKDAILDGMVESVFAEIDTPPHDLPWRDAIRHRCTSARQVLATHPWAVPMLESRPAPGPATLHHHDAVLGCLLRADLPMAAVAHAYALIDAFVYGFAIQEASLPTGDAGSLDEIATAVREQLPPDQFPNLLAFTTDHVLQPGYSFGDSFDVGLDIVLDGIERLARDHRRSAPLTPLIPGDDRD
jgi:AcrR family transcriptional regulator